MIPNLEVRNCGYLDTNDSSGLNDLLDKHEWVPQSYQRMGAEGLLAFD